MTIMRDSSLYIKYDKYHVQFLSRSIFFCHGAVSVLKKIKDIGANNHYFIGGITFFLFFHMLSLCNFPLWVNKKGLAF